MNFKRGETSLKHCGERQEICVDGVKYAYNLTHLDENTVELCVTPNCLPTACFDVARITCKKNCCGGGYFQGFINTDPVVIIQDVELHEMICRCIRIYFERTNLPGRNNNRNRFFW